MLYIRVCLVFLFVVVVENMYIELVEKELDENIYFVRKIIVGR